jgi:ABC-2 type transport system ATP-binding protein
LLDWLGAVPIAMSSIGTEDLRSLYDRFHGPNATDEE